MNWHQNERRNPKLFQLAKTYKPMNSFCSMFERILQTELDNPGHCTDSFCCFLDGFCNEKRLHQNNKNASKCKNHWCSQVQMTCKSLQSHWEKRLNRVQKAWSTLASKNKADPWRNKNNQRSDNSDDTQISRPEFASRESSEPTQKGPKPQDHQDCLRHDGDKPKVSPKYAQNELASLWPKQKGWKAVNCVKSSNKFVKGFLYTTAATSEFSQTCFVYLRTGWSASKVATKHGCTVRRRSQESQGRALCHLFLVVQSVALSSAVVRRDGTADPA